MGFFLIERRISCVLDRGFTTALHLPHCKRVYFEIGSGLVTQEGLTPMILLSSPPE